MGDNGGWGYEVTILCAMVFRSAVEELHKELDKLGFGDVRPSHGFAFQRLTPNGATGIELAEHLGITKQAATLMVDYLEEHGYVKREPHPTDRRGKLVRLTERGWACIDATETIFTAIEQRWRGILGERGMEALRSDLRTVVGSFGDSGGKAFRPVW